MLLNDNGRPTSDAFKEDLDLIIGDNIKESNYIIYAHYECIDNEKDKDESEYCITE